MNSLDAWSSCDAHHVLEVSKSIGTACGQVLYFKPVDNWWAGLASHKRDRKRDSLRVAGEILAEEANTCQFGEKGRVNAKVQL